MNDRLRYCTPSPGHASKHGPIKRVEGRVREIHIERLGGQDFGVVSHERK